MQIMSNVIVECQIISETLFFYKVYEDLMTAALCGGCSSRWTTVLESLLAPSFDSASLSPGFYFIPHTCQSQSGSLLFKNVLLLL